MKPQRLALVPSVTLTTLITQLFVPPATTRALSSDRKVFWKAYLDWLSTAPDDEAEQLEWVLAQHAHHVRPLMAAVSDAIHDPATSAYLPGSLLANLYAAGWQPQAKSMPRAA